MRPLNRFGSARVIAPFGFQPTRQGLRGGFGALGTSLVPVGVGAGQGAATGASEGASIGSQIVPGFGTAIGAVVGAIAGAIAGAIGKTDPEVNNLNAAVALYRGNPQSLFQIANKYLVLAGWFDLEPNQINVNGGNQPVYMQYGRMGEANFARDLVQTIYNAAQSGQIQPTDTFSTIYQNVVVPWIASWGKGNIIDNVNPGFIPTLIQGLILDYVSGYWKNAWRARSGDIPTQFAQLPNFSLPGAATAPSSAVNPVGSAVTTTATAPAYSPNGTVITPSYPGPMVTPSGTFMVSGQTFAMNGAAVATSPTTAGLAYVNGQVYRYDANGGTFVWNNGWVATNQAPAPGAVITSGIAQTPAAPTTTINPVGSGATTAATSLTPAQLVATPPAVGSSVQYAPDMSSGGTPMGLPAGMVFTGTDPYNGSWILQNSANGQLYVLWQGTLQPYTSTMFSPTAAAVAAAPVVTGSGTTGVNSSTTAPTPVTTTTQPATADTSWVLPVALIGGIILATQGGRRHKRQ